MNNDDFAEYLQFYDFSNVVIINEENDEDDEEK